MVNASTIIICATCNRVLDLYTDATTTRYQHTLGDSPADHAPVPVEAPPGYRGGHCDFCNADHPAFVLPARDFLLPVPGQNSLGDWAACQLCADLITKNQWTELVVRVTEIEAHRGLHLGAGGVAALHGLYALLRHNVTGPLRPIETDTETPPEGETT